MRRAAAHTLLLAALCLCACSPLQSPLAPEGDTARRIASLFWLFTTVCGAIWLIVMVLLLVALFRRRPQGDAPDASPDAARERRIGWVVSGGVAATVVVLIAFTLASFVTNKGFAEPRPHGLTIKVTGHQWWWQVDYEAHAADQTFQTANEIHIPAGQPVRLDFESPDVIHSFWVPNLAGKQDLIPGRYTSLTIEADKPGVYRGQCAEYCGIQHAHMAMFVFADSAGDFAHWHAQQLKSAVSPNTPELRHGQQVFLSNACAMCHTIGGTSAGGIVGPDLTHFGSRTTIAAGTLPNSLANLAGWIADPQRVKPYTAMPAVALSGPDLIAVSKYLESLK